MKHIIGTFVAAALVGGFVGCVADTEDHDHLGQVQLPANATDAEIAAACEANNPKKQAVCHIPPGNPDNAHTICISKNAVAKHLALHGDYLGACEPSDGSGGGDSTGSGGSGGSSSGSGGSSSGSGGSGSGSGGGSAQPCSSEYPPCNSNADCDLNSSCMNGCCVPYTN